jgi:hypothetical protein
MLKTSAFAIFGAALVSSASAALLTNGNFEDLPIGTEWTFLNGGVTNDYNGLLAPEGEYFGYGNSETIAAVARNAQEFLNPSTQGTLTFLYNFFTDEPVGGPAYNDVFEVRLLAANGASQTYRITDVYSATFGSPVKPSNFALGTGWLQGSVDISAFLQIAGQPINVIFQTVDAGDSLYKSGFAIDTVGAVPEPGTMAALALGGAALARRRRK